MKKVAIVTGASRGIGAATAKLLAKHDYAVCLNFNHSKEKADQLVTEIKSFNGNAIAVQANMSSEEDVLKLFRTVDNEFGPITALINNAGINGGTCTVENIQMNCLQSVFALNVFGTFIACREAVKRMKQTGGSIVNLSSEAAKFGGMHLAHYAASKAAVNTFTIGFAKEVASFNIRVNAISPGIIDTDMHSSANVEALMNTLPMKRMGKASEVSELILWLLSDAASYVSGAIIPVTGSR